MIPRQVFAQTGKVAQLSPPASRPPKRWQYPYDVAYYQDERGRQFLSGGFEKPYPLYENKHKALTAKLTMSNPLLDASIASRPVLEAKDVAELKKVADKNRYDPFSQTWLKPEYRVFVPNSWGGGTADVTLLFSAADEMMRHGLRKYFEGKSNAVLVQVPGVEPMLNHGLRRAWAVGITDGILAPLLQARGISGWRITTIAAYSTGYRGFNETIEQLAGSPKQTNAAGRLTLGKHLKTAILFDCLYVGDDAVNKKTTQTETALRTLRRLAPSTKFVVYGATQLGTPRRNGDTRVPQSTLKSIFGSDYAFVDLAKQTSALLTLAYARTFEAAIADGYYKLTDFDAPIQALIKGVPKRGDLTSAVDASFRAFPGKTSLASYASSNKAGVDEVMRQQMTKLLPKVQADWLIGFSPDAGDMAHDGIIREFGHEFLLG